MQTVALANPLLLCIPFLELMPLVYAGSANMLGCSVVKVHKLYLALLFLKISSYPFVCLFGDY
jgi:hypothetical protein